MRFLYSFACRGCFIMTFILLFAFSCDFEQKRANNSEVKSNDSITNTSNHGIYKNDTIINTFVFIDYLKDSLWCKRDAYDAGHYLLIPLHYAFLINDSTLIKSFESHFYSAINAYKTNSVKLNTLDELQYLCLASQFLVLSNSKTDSKLNTKLFSLVKERFLYYWINSPAWQWEREPFEGGIRERIIWKLNNVQPGKKYYNVLHDSDFYAIGLGADLLNYSRKNNVKCEECEEIPKLFLQIMNSRLDTIKPGWVFQAGYWSDHKDFAYAAYLTKPEESSEPIIIPDLMEDSSHAHRWPLWLLQLSGIMDVEKLKERLIWQLLNIVIDKNVEIGVPVLKNYLCGNNGYFRWKYNTNKTTGYGPYQLSSTFGLGWWSLLGNRYIAAYYRQLALAYPLNSAQKQLYSTISTRERHLLVSQSDYNGIKVSLALMAEKIAEKKLYKK